MNAVVEHSSYHSSSRIEPECVSCGSRIAHVRGSRSRQEYADALGIHLNTLKNYETNKRQPDSTTLNAIYATDGVLSDWILRGECPMRKGDDADMRKLAVTSKLIGSGDYAHIPLYDVEASAGPGKMVVSEDIKEMLVFRRDWIRSELGVSPDHLYLITVAGDSMLPNLHPGDVALIHDQQYEKSVTTVPCDGIYLLRLDGSLLVKRLQRLPGGKVRVISDNSQSYEPFTVDLSDLTDYDFCVLGRIVWAGRRM